MTKYWNTFCASCDKIVKNEGIWQEKLTKITNNDILIEV